PDAEPAVAAPPPAHAPSPAGDETIHGSPLAELEAQAASEEQIEADPRVADGETIPATTLADLRSAVENEAAALPGDSTEEPEPEDVITPLESAVEPEAVAPAETAPVKKRR